MVVMVGNNFSDRVRHVLASLGEIWKLHYVIYAFSLKMFSIISLVISVHRIIYCIQIVDCITSYVNE